MLRAAGILNKLVSMLSRPLESVRPSILAEHLSPNVCRKVRLCNPSFLDLSSISCQPKTVALASRAAAHWVKAESG